MPLSQEQRIEALRKALAKGVEERDSIFSSMRLAEDPLYERAHHAALRLLTVRERSVHEMRDRLFRKGFGEEIVDPLIERLCELDLLNDKRFAQLWVKQRSQNQAYSGRRLSYELRRKGIADEDIEVALRQVDAEESKERAKDFLRRKCQRMAILQSQDRPSLEKRLYTMLLRRGYDYEESAQLAHAVVEEVL